MPSIIGIFVIFLTIFFLGKYLVTTGVPLTQGTTKNIKNLAVTNISPTQATIFWQTDKPTKGWILYGEKTTNLKEIATDARDTDNTKNTFTNHYINVKNLSSSRQFYFKVVVDNRLATGIGVKPFEFRTLDKDIQVSDLRPAYGKIFNSSGKPVSGAVVLLKAGGRHPLSALSKASGEWLIPLNYIINERTNSLQTLAPEDKIQLEVWEEAGGKSMVTTNLQNISPIPDVIITGKNYDFTHGQEVLSASSKKAREQKIEILFPKRNAVIPSRNPLIKGSALPNHNVEVAISQVDGKVVVKSNAKTDNRGQWNLTLSQDLDPRRYSLTITTSDMKNSAVQKTQFFTIAKSGEQVLAEATASASLTPTATPTSTVVPTSTAGSTLRFL